MAHVGPGGEIWKVKKHLMISKQPNKVKNLEIYLPFKHASLSSRCRHALNSFARGGFCTHTAKGGTENPLCGLSVEKNISSLTI